LAQLPEAHVRLEHGLPARRLEVAAEDLHQRRLARTVGADQAVAVAVGELGVDVLEQGLRPELHREVYCGKHSVSCPHWRGRSNRCPRLRARYGQPTQARALRNRRIQGESSPSDGSRQLIWIVRKTRSGCGIRIVARPYSLVKPVRPPGEPFGFAG